MAANVSANRNVELREKMFAHRSNRDTHSRLTRRGTFQGRTQIAIAIFDGASQICMARTRETSAALWLLPFHLAWSAFNTWRAMGAPVVSPAMTPPSISTTSFSIFHAATRAIPTLPAFQFTVDSPAQEVADRQVCLPEWQSRMGRWDSPAVRKRNIKPPGMVFRGRDQRSVPLIASAMILRGMSCPVQS